MASDDDDEYEQLAYNQRLKAAVHYTVGQICEQFGEKNDVTFSRQLIATISETTYRQSGVLATDLELFAKHAKRTTINADDVKLAVRKSSALYGHLNDLNAEQNSKNEVQREKKRQSKKSKKKPETE